MNCEHYEEKLPCLLEITSKSNPKRPEKMVCLSKQVQRYYHEERAIYLNNLKHPTSTAKVFWNNSKVDNLVQLSKSVDFVRNCKVTIH